MSEEQVMSFLHRIDKLTIEHQGKFGVMTANQMICHCTDQLRIALGTKKLGDQGEFDLNEIISLAKGGRPVPTPKGLGQLEGDGTTPTSLENDKEILKNYILDFVKLPDEYDYAAHPYFGKIDKKQWTNPVIYHLNHHLGQFNV
jgi:hypothetical protein